MFTIEEVDALIPELSQRVAHQLALQSEIERLLRQLAAELGEVPTEITMQESDTNEVRECKRDLKSKMLEYGQGWQQVQELGAVIKDPQIGLLDFYGQIDGRLVWLCWRFGEDRLLYYHELDAGVAGRRALRPDVRGRLLN